MDKEELAELEALLEECGLTMHYQGDGMLEALMEEHAKCRALKKAC